METFRDHDNREEIGYKLCGQDFVHDLLGLLDLLWPLVVLMLQSQANWYPGWKLCSHLPLVKEQMESFIDEVSEDIPASNVCPRLHERIEELREKRYGRSELEEGWFVIGGGEGQMPVNWSARELHDCVDDLKQLARDVINELDQRYQSSFSDLNKLLSKCFDFARLFAGLCGTRVEDRAPVDNQKFSELGAVEFRQCVNYASQLPHVQDKNLELGSELSSTVFWRLKKVLIEIVWGTMFPELFSRFFRKITSSSDGKVASHALVIPNGLAVKSFQTSTPPQFCLSQIFKLELSNGEKMQVLFDEEEFIQSLYTDSSFYTAVGQEFCLLFDIFYAKSGTEAVAESFYRVVEKQEMDGGQSNSVLMNRAKVDWSLPSVIQCDSALNGMAKLYINGDKDRGLKRHHVPVYHFETFHHRLLLSLNLTYYKWILVIFYCQLSSGF